jgi:hypothetical protein
MLDRASSLDDADVGEIADGLVPAGVAAGRQLNPAASSA